jgi:serine/threonine protein kinase
MDALPRGESPPYGGVVLMAAGGTTVKAVDGIVYKRLLVDECLQDQIENELRFFHAKIEHPNIVRYLRAYTLVAPPALVITMPRAKMDLRELIHSTDTRPLARKIASDMASGLDYLQNTARLLHGDVKPSNVLHDGRHFILTDFDHCMPNPPPGVVFSATPGFKCPEGPYSAEAEIYSFALTVSHCYYREKMDDAMPVCNTTHRAQTNQWVLTNLFDPDLLEPQGDDLLDELLPKALSRDPKARPQIAAFIAPPSTD